MSTTHELYQVEVKPGKNPEVAAARLAKYIIDRWMPGHAGAAVIMIGPRLAEHLLPFMLRPKPTTLTVDTLGTTPEIREGTK